MPNYFSVSDMSTFLACREKWDLSSPNRQSLRHKATPRMYLTTGSALHKAIEEQEKGAENAVEVADAFLTQEREDRVAAYTAENGFKPWPAEMAKFDTGADFTLQLVSQYFEHYGTENPLADQGLTYLATEVPFKINISDEINIPDSWFVGTFDGIARDDYDHLYLVENKSYTQKPDTDDLRVNFQTTGYAVAWQMLTNIPLTGALYNGVAKKLIKDPRYLKSGALSTAVDQVTTWERFTSAMQRDGISIEDPKYAGILKKLADIERQGDTRFFHREKFYYNETQLLSWLSEFYDIAHEMTNSPKIYRTVPYNGCGPSGADCWYRDVCIAKHTGTDVDSLVEKRYTRDSYGTIQAVEGLEAVMVASIDDLREALRAYER